MIRRLARYLGPEHQGMIYTYLRWIITSCILQGVTLALTIPILRNLLTGHFAIAGWWLGGFVVAAIVSWCIEYLATVKGFDAGNQMLDMLRYRLGDHVSTLPLGWFTPANTSTLGHTLSKGVMDVISLPVHHLTGLIKSLVVPLVLIAALLVTDWRVGLIALAALPPVLAVYWWAGRLGRRADAAVNETTAEASDRMVEFAQAQPVLRSYGQTGPIAEQFDQSLREQSRSERRQLWLVLPPVMLNGFTVRLVLLALLATVIAFAAGVTDPVELATLIAMLPIINLLVTPLGDVATHATTIRVCSAQMDAVDAILDAMPLPEPAQPQRPADASIEYRGVGFAYDTAPILEDLDFAVPAGTTTAIVGPSGSGRRRSSGSRHGSSTPSTAPSASAEYRSPTSVRMICSRWWRPCSRTTICSPAPWSRTCASRTPTPPTPNCDKPSPRPDWTTWSTSCPTAGIARSVKAANTSPAANGSALLSRGRY